MKRIIPANIYENLPCSMVAVGCALGYADRERVKGLKSDLLKNDGYLSLDGMNKLIRANTSVKRRSHYRRGERPYLKDFCHSFRGRAVVCVRGHFVYVENDAYYSFFSNENDEIIEVWELS